jgi:hypothetical protein
LLTHLANLMTDFNLWLDRLSNWQFVAAVASVNVVGLVVAGFLLELTAGPAVALRPLVTLGVIETVGSTGVLSWRRWK